MEADPQSGRQYLLDKKEVVTIQKVVTRSKTIFNIVTPNGSLIRVEKERLSDIVSPDSRPPSEP